MEQTREALRERIAQREAEEVQLAAAIEQTRAARVIVEQTAYSGAVVWLGGHALSVRRQTGPGEFRLGEEGVVFVSGQPERK